MPRFTFGNMMLYNGLKRTRGRVADPHADPGHSWFRCGRHVVKITRVPFRLLTDCLLVVCFSGGHAIANRSFDVKVMVVMGIVAYLLSPWCWD